MEKDFQTFLTRLKLESAELPTLITFFRSLLLFQYLFPTSMDEIVSDKKHFVSKELQENNSSPLHFILNTFSSKIDSSLIAYLKNTDWWWEYLILFKQSGMTIYQLSSLHESTMTVEHKKSSGVYFTPEPQIKFICKYSLYRRLLFSSELKINKTVLAKIIFLQEVPSLNKNEMRLLAHILINLKVIDPSCGTGLFLYEMNMLVGSLLRTLTSRNLLNPTEYQEHLQTFRSNLTGYDIDEDNIVFTKFVLLSTFMNLQPDIRKVLDQNFEVLYDKINHIQELNFLQTSINLENKFDLCIGNPPYLRHHEFDKKSVMESIIRSSALQNAINNYKLKFDAKADLYVYFWVKGMTILNVNGVLSFILSRSWYSSRFMAPINTLIANEDYSLDLVLELPSDPWSKAQIRTNIIFGHRKTNTLVEKGITILVWKKPLSLLLGRIDRYMHLFTKYPGGYMSNHQGNQILSEETKNYRISHIKDVKPLFSKDYSSFFPLMRIDYFTSAPLLIHDILFAHKSKFCLLSDLGKLSLGSTTGANAFFYLDQRTIVEYSLSSKLLAPMTKSPKDAVTLSDFSANKKLYLLHVSPDLRLKDHPNLTKYLEKFQEVILSRPYFQNKSKEHWYKINLVQPDIIIPNMTFMRSFVAYNGKKLHIDKQWIGFWLYDSNCLLLLLGFMNSTLGLLLREVQGTKSLGLGSLKLSLGECKNLLVLDPRLYSKSIVRDLNIVVQSLLSEKIPVFEEKTKYTEIQEQLDKIICIDYLGLDENFIREIQRALVFEVEWRLGNLTT
jgi:hypothetical protein